MTGYISLLTGTQLEDKKKEQDEATLAESQTALKEAGDKALITLDRVGSMIHGEFDPSKPIEANQAVINFLDRLTEVLVNGGYQLVADFASSNDTGANQAAVRELESRLETANYDMADLTRSAERATALEVQRDELREALRHKTEQHLNEVEDLREQVADAERRADEAKAASQAAEEELTRVNIRIGKLEAELDTVSSTLTESQRLVRTGESEIKRLKKNRGSASGTQPVAKTAAPPRPPQSQQSTTAPTAEPTPGDTDEEATPPPDSQSGDDGSDDTATQPVVDATNDPSIVPGFDDDGQPEGPPADKPVSKRRKMRGGRSRDDFGRKN